MSHPRVIHGLEVIEIVLFLVRLFLSLQLLVKKDPAEKCANAVEQGFSTSVLLPSGWIILCCVVENWLVHRCRMVAAPLASTH